MDNDGEDRQGPGKNPVALNLYREGDEEQLNDLFNLVFKAKRSVSGWRWKFEDNPANDHIYISHATLDDGKIVGMYIVLPAIIKVRDELVLATQPVEIAIHPDFRGKWIVKQLKIFLKEETDGHDYMPKFGYGFPTRAHAKLGLRFMSYNLLGELPIMGIKNGRDSLIPLKPIRRVVSRFTYFADHLHTLYRISTWAGDERKRHGPLEFIELERFGEEIDRLWDNISEDYPILTHRSSRYLNWRYIDNPMALFTVLAAKREGEVAGYMVYTTHVEEGIRNGIIFDFIYPKDDPAGKILLREGLLRILKERVGSIRCAAMPQSSLSGYLASLGFVKWLSSPLISFEVFDESLDKEFLSDLNHWYLSIGDTDLLGW